MSKVMQATSYTPIFPPPLPHSSSSSPFSISYDSTSTSGDDLNKRGTNHFIDGLKERYLLLANLPEELCPPSRETSPGAESRIEALRLRMRKALTLPLWQPLELTLACVGVKGGDWVGDPVSDEDQEMREFVLPDTEEEWFEWEKQRKVAQENRKAERLAAEHRKRIAKWSGEIEEASTLENLKVPDSSQEQRLDEIGYTVAKQALDEQGGIIGPEDNCSQSRPTYELYREQTDPVERASSPVPLVSSLDPLPDYFFDSISPSGSPLLFLHDVEQDLSLLDDIPLSPSFNIQKQNISTPIKQTPLLEPNLQLSSPVSPPRSLHPLPASQSSLPLPREKRPHESEQPFTEDADHEPSTPRSVKRAKAMVEPITPKSVARPSASQEPRQSNDPKRLPTLGALLAASSRRGSSRRGTPLAKERVQRRKTCPITEPPSLQQTVLPDLPSSQPSYSKFRPPYQSTQHRQYSLPPSPSRPMMPTQSLSPLKPFSGTASSGIGFFQSQFNVESRVDKVAAFLEEDVWDPEAEV